MSNRFDILPTSITDLLVLHHKPIGDSRGYLERLFCANELQTLLHGKTIIQINHSSTVKRGTVRGMHFQYPPYTELKFVSCLHGKVFDVSIDLRHGSPTFLNWHAEILSADRHNTLMIPEGFAHGFQTLTKDCQMLYLHTANYQPSAEGGLNAQDPRLAIQWPLPISAQSHRDQAHAMLTSDFLGITV